METSIEKNTLTGIELIDNSENENDKMIIFFLNNQKFGIDIENVIEVIENNEITKVIHTPSYIEGVINLRGKILAIINLKNFFGLKTENKNYLSLRKPDKIIVVKYENKMCGLLVDDIDDIIEIAEEDIDCLPVTVNGKLADFLHGLLNFNGNPISIVNLHNIYFSEEIKKFDYED